MGKRKELSVAQRGAILYCNQRGDSCRVIDKAVGCHPATVSSTLKRYAETGSLASKSRVRCPHLIKPTQCKELKKLVTHGRRHLCTAAIWNEWKKKTNENVSVRTIGRELRSLGLTNCLARKKPLISRKNKAARLAWCRDHASWTTEDWAKVLWSDESTFTQFETNRCSRVWREPKDKWSPSCLAATVKHSPSRMHWGCFSRQGLGPLVPLAGSVTGATHIKTLRNHALPTLRRMFPGGDGWFQEDNAHPHKAKVAAAFREKNGFHTLSWPAQSPDLNPIENLWVEVKRNLHKQKKKPTNLDDLERHVKRAWRSIPKELIENLVDSMPRRIRAVIAAGGGPTKY